MQGMYEKMHLYLARSNLVEWSCTFLSKPETELINMSENKIKSTSLSEFEWMVTLHAL